MARHSPVIFESGPISSPVGTKNSFFWKDIEGLPDSRSPGRPWPELQTPLGLNYAGEDVHVMEKQIEWAADYGLDFFAFDWYWKGDVPDLNHAITAFLKAGNRNRMQFCLMWANHTPVPTTMKQFTKMVNFWVQNYFFNPQMMSMEGKPIVIIFSPEQLRSSAHKLGKNTKDILNLAREMAVKAGLPGIYFIATTYAKSSWVNEELPQEGYDALTAYNYHSSGFIGEFSTKVPASNNYSELFSGYKSQWEWILQNSNLPYIVPMTAGWDSRPWGSDTPHDRSDSTPESFRQMLLAGRDEMERYPEKTMRMGIIYAWNEFGEGGYIAPTKKWGFQYLQAVKDVFGP